MKSFDFRRLVLFLCMLLMVFAAGCGGGGGSDGDSGTPPPADGGSPDDTVTPPPVSTGKLVLGTGSTIAEQRVPAGGGTVQAAAPGSALNGLTIEIPPGAYGSERNVKVTASNIQSHNAGPFFNPVTPLIRVEGADAISEQLMQVTIPAKTPQNHFAMAFFYDPETEKFEGMPLIRQEADTVTVATRHFSSFVVSAIPEETLKVQMPITSEYLPGRDDFKFANHGSWLAPSGHCAGQSIGAIYYYTRQQLAGEPNLYGHFDNNGETPTPAIWQDDSNAYKFCSVLQHDIHWDDLSEKIDRSFQDAEPTQVWKAFAYSILLTGEPQLEGMFTEPDKDGKRGGHAMVIYGVEENDDGDQWRLLVSDPNYPAAGDRYIYFDEFGMLEPYSSAANAQEAAAGKGRLYTQIYYIGKAALIPWSVVDQRYEELEEGLIGDDIFPECTIMVSEVTDMGNQLLEINDGFHETTAPIVHLYSSVKTQDGEEGATYISVFEGLESTTPVDVDLDKMYLAELAEGDNWFGFYSQVNYNGYLIFLDFQWINLYYKPQPTYDLPEYILQENLKRTENGFVPDPYTVTGSISAPNLNGMDASITDHSYDANQHFSYNSVSFSADVTAKLPFDIEIRQNVDGVWNDHAYTLPNGGQVTLTRTTERYWLKYRKSDDSEAKGYSNKGVMHLRLDKSNLKPIAEDMGLYVFEGVVTFQYKYNTHVSGPEEGYEYDGSVWRDELFLTFINLFVTVPD